MTREGRRSFRLFAVLFVLAAGVMHAQVTRSAHLHPSGQITVSAGDAQLATIELNAHGPQWSHAPQTEARAERIETTDAGEHTMVATLPIPRNDAGALTITQRLSPVHNGFHISYDAVATDTLALNGLQFSMNLPVEAHAGHEVLVTPAFEEPDLVGLPKEQSETRFQLWSGQGRRIEIGKGTDAAITLQLIADAGIVVQDLRKWDNMIFEVRVPAIMEDPAREIAAGERFHLEVTVTFPGPVNISTQPAAE